MNKTVQYHHPCDPSLGHDSASTAAAQNDEIPKWLKLYFKAPHEIDRKLQWDLFGLQELESYEAMYNRLYLEETAQINKAYETYKNRIWEEMEKRRTVSHL